MSGIFSCLKYFLLLFFQQRRRRLSIVLLMPLLFASCDKQAVSLFSSKQPAPAALQLIEGKVFPAITLKNFSGESVPLQSLQGKMLILNVWATWCAPCRKEMPSLERLSKSLDPLRFAVLGLSTDNDEYLAAEFLSSNNISFGNYIDKNGKLSQQMGLKVYPETFLISQDGILVKRVLGEQDWSSPRMIQELEVTYELNRRSNNMRAGK